MISDNTFKPLALLYRRMDKNWNKVAEKYNFKCNGCKDNCCKSLFFHHTYIEQAYLRHGFDLLDQTKKEMILSRAENYCRQTFSWNQENGNQANQSSEIKSLKINCPANEEGRCILYSYRPLICRLHGLPHELNRPGFEPFKGPGCAAGKFHDKPYIQFDRTPFYQQMAQLEMTFRQEFNKTGKIKETIAQILLAQ